MITDIYVVYTDSSIKEIYGDISLEISPFFHFIDLKSKDGRKEGLRIKSYWAARLDPFIIMYDKTKPVRAFYQEDGNAVEKSIKYLNNEGKIC